MKSNENNSNLLLGCTNHRARFEFFLNQNSYYQKCLFELMPVKTTRFTKVSSSSQNNRNHSTSCILIPSSFVFLQARIFEIVVCFSVGLTDKHMKQLSHFCHLVTVSPKNVYYLTEMLVERARSLISRDEYPMYMLSVYKYICTAIIGMYYLNLIRIMRLGGGVGL